MFIEVVRQHLETLPPEQAGWLAGVRDPFIGKALSLMHGSPAFEWTIEDLASQVGLSRPVLAEHFVELVGIPPMRYLAKWRIQIASGMLIGDRANVATVAAEIGYKSDAAFSRAFKKMVGVNLSLAWPLGSQRVAPYARRGATPASKSVRCTSPISVLGRRCGPARCPLLSVTGSPVIVFTTSDFDGLR